MALSEKALLFHHSLEISEAYSQKSNKHAVLDRCPLFQRTYRLCCLYSTTITDMTLGLESGKKSRK